MLEEIKNIKATKNKLREFGITLGVMFGLLGILLWWKGKNFYLYFLLVSFSSLTLGLVLPIVLKPVYRVWMTVALVIGFIMTRVILYIMFYLVLTPLGFLSRLISNDSMNLKIDKSCKSYWIKRTNKEFDKKSYEKQF